MKDPRYIIVLGACIVQFTIIGFFIAFSLFFSELEAEFGWSRTMISAGISLSTFMMGTLAIFGGQLNDRFGPRIVLTISGVMFALGLVLLSQITQPWQHIVLFGTLIAAGLATHDVVTLSVVARWFDKKRGIMTGVVKTGTAAGQVVVPPVAAMLILWYGWRNGLLVIAACSAVLLIIAALMIRLPRPEEHPQPSETNTEGVTYAQARRTRAFWTICAMQFLFFPTMMTVPLHLGVHGQDLGMAKEKAALLLSIMGAASVIGRLVIGTLADRIGGKNSYSLALGGLVISLVLLPMITAHGGLMAVTALYGLCHGAMFVVVSPTVARFFGMRAHGSIFGTVLFFGTIGGALGPTLAGWVFDTWGSYTPAFLTLAVAAALALVLTRTLPDALPNTPPKSASE